MMTEQQIAEANLNQAIDQQDSFPSLVKAFEAYYENAWDEAKENRLSSGKVTDIYEELMIGCGYAAELDAMWRLGN